MVARAARPDILIADFEGPDYGAWAVTGTTFGTGPARGTLARQYEVSGHKGNGLVNGYHGEDASTGTLTSPEFIIKRPTIAFRISGGHHPGKACLNLIVDGRPVRSATGENSERLERRAWGVSGLIGRKARIQIVDDTARSWGHINVDDIMQTDARDVPIDTPEPLWNEKWRPRYHYTPERNWLNDPNGLVFHDGEYHLFHQYNADGIPSDHKDWFHAVSRDLVHWEPLGVAIKGEDGVSIWSGSAVVDHRNTSGFGKDGEPAMVAIYTGFRLADGMQSQCIAYSTDRGRTWSKYAKNPVIDWEPSFRDPKVFWHEPTRKWVMVVSKADEKRVRFYGSPDLKRWEKLSTFGPAGAPVDRKANWECPDLFPLPIEGEPGKTKWVLHAGMGGGHVSGGSGGEYFIGEFDGTAFRNDNAPDVVLWAGYGKDDYAAISWNDAAGPNGEAYWIGWMSGLQYAGDIPTHPWLSGLTLPRVLSLRRFPEGLRLITKPAPQLKTLRGVSRRYEGEVVAPDRAFVPDRSVWGDALEIEAVLKPGSAREVGIVVRKGEDEETRVGYDVAQKALFVDRTRSGRTDFNAAFPGRSSGPLSMRDGTVSLRLFVDRASVEVFGNGGETVLTELIFPKPGSQGVQVYAMGGAAEVVSLRIWKLGSALPKGDAR